MKLKPQATSKVFKRALISSLIAHLALFLLIFVSPSLSKSSKKGMIHYIPLTLVGLPGGGGQATTTVQPTELKRETLRDLTTIQKLQEEPKSSLRYPVEKPKKELKASKDKKAVISKPQENLMAKSLQEGKPGSSGASASGSGLRIGVGGPGSGEGFGSGYADQIGISNFPYAYYLQIVRDKISSNWFTSLVEPGLAGNLQTTVYFRILKNGQISDIEVKESSGLVPFDKLAVGAIMRAAPFPPLPTDYDPDYLGIFLIFEHSR